MNSSILKWFRLLADPARVRILLLLEKEELSVAELQEILSMGQSRISMSLSQLRQAGLVEDRRNGKHSLYRIHEDLQGNTELIGLLRQAASEISESAQDAASLDLALRKRRDRMRAYFDELAGKLAVRSRARAFVERNCRSLIKVDAANGGGGILGAGKRPSRSCSPSAPKR